MRHLLERWRLASTFQDRLGGCYQLAGRAVVDGKGDLIHGTIQGNNQPRLDHAWVDTGQGIYDAVIDEEISYDKWIAFANPINVTQYTRDEALIQMIRHEHWGPW